MICILHTRRLCMCDDNEFGDDAKGSCGSSDCLIQGKENDVSVYIALQESEKYTHKKNVRIDVLTCSCNGTIR